MGTFIKTPSPVYLPRYWGSCQWRQIERDRNSTASTTPLWRRLRKLPSFALRGEPALVPRLPLCASLGQTLLTALGSTFNPALLPTLSAALLPARNPALSPAFSLVALDHGDDVSVHHELVQRHQQFSCLVHRAGEQHRNDCNGYGDGAKVGERGESEFPELRPGPVGETATPRQLAALPIEGESEPR